MKKVTGFVFALLLIVSLAVPAMAASTEYEIPEFDLTISIPDEYDVFTRNMRSDDPLLREYGVTKDDLLEILGDNIYLDALSYEGDEEVVVSIFEDIGLDLTSLGDTGLEMLASALQEEYEGLGFTVFSADVYHHSQLGFLCLYFYIPEDNVYVFQYYTIYDGDALSITLRSASKAISSAQERQIQAIVDSISLSSYAKPQVEAAPAFLYTDEKTGTTFTVPAGWTENSLSQEREYLDTTFSFAADPGLQITYGSSDFSSELSFSERLYANQPEHDEEFCAVIAEEMGVPESSVCVKTYNGKDYYVVEGLYTSEEYGMKFTFALTQALHVENGWVYLFQITGKMNDPSFGELEKVLESVEYGSKGAHSGNGLIIGILVVVLLAVLILLAIVIFITRKQKKEAGDMDRPAFVYCQNCGKRLPGDSQFCDSCGARLRK